jgi:hypothetical protein
MERAVPFITREPHPLRSHLFRDASVYLNSRLLVPFDDRHVLTLGIMKEGGRANVRRAGRDGIIFMSLRSDDAAVQNGWTEGQEVERYYGWRRRGDGVWQSPVN